MVLVSNGRIQAEVGCCRLWMPQSCKFLHIGPPPGHARDSQPGRFWSRGQPWPEPRRM